MVLIYTARHGGPKPLTVALHTSGPVNGTEYGLVCYVYTRDLRRGLRGSEALGGHDGLGEFMETTYIAAGW